MYLNAEVYLGNGKGRYTDAITYANSFAGRFFLDDVPCVIDNPTIRSLSPPPLWGPPESTTSDRPLVNYTLALNYAMSGLEPWSYHLFNLAGHLLGVFCLYGILRRSAGALPSMRGRLIPILSRRLAELRASGALAMR